MIDNIRIICKDVEIVSHLTNSYFGKRSSLFERFNNQFTFKMFNPNDFDKSSFMRVESYNGKFLRIIGSLRKWYFGKHSLRDFSKNEYEDAVKFMLSLLEIPFAKCNSLYLSKIEVGLNVKVSIPSEEIIRRFTGFKSSCYVKGERQGFRFYETKSLEVIMYDKIREISKDFIHKRHVKTLEEESFLKKYQNKYYLRIEFKIKKNVLYHLEFNTLEDSIFLFHKLNVYFWRNAKYIFISEIFNDIPLIDFAKCNGKEFTNYLLYLGIYCIGVDRFNEIKNRKIRYKYKKLISAPIGRAINYDKILFIKEVNKQLVSTMKSIPIA